MTRHKNYDNNGNNTQILEDYNAATQTAGRVLNAAFDSSNQETGTTIPSVPIDDPTQPASMTQRPEVIANVVTQIVYNAKGYKVAELRPAAEDPTALTITNPELDLLRSRCR